MSSTNERRREAHRLARVAEDQGFRVKETRSGFMAFSKAPDGPTAGWHKTPSDHRWIKNASAALRRIGVDL